MRFVSRKRAGVSSIVGSIFFILIMIVAIGSLVTIFNSFTSYNSQVTKAGSAQVSALDTDLSVSGSSFGAFPTTSSNFNVATSCTATTSTSPTDQGHLFYAAGMWWDFFTCNSNFQYSTSFYGVTWESPTTIPNLVASTVGPYFDISEVGSTIYLAIASTTTLTFQLGIGTLASGGTVSAPAGTITWSSLPAAVTTGAQPTGPIQVSVDGAGNVWVALVQGTCTTATNCAIGIYEREACATGVAANQGWENTVSTSCSNANAPTNYAPTTPNLAALAPNANMILLAPASSLSPTGAILIYETAASVVAAGTTGTIGSAGTVAIYTQAALASGGTTWNPITLTGVTDYSLTSSSALMIGNTIYFAGLQNAATGATTGDLKFWTVTLTSMTAGTNTAEQTIEGTTEAWMAALTSSGTTLALFDAYTLAGATTVQYYTSATLGTIWSSPAITLETSETASITGLTPSENGFAVTWENGASAIRFAALSSFTVTNNSPFAVHLVDLYIYNSGTNTLVAHYYYNSTEDFDYYVGQGNSMVLPVRFVWAAATTYLVTIGTDTGVDTQLTATSPPVPTVTCPAGYFGNYQIGPSQTCSSVPAAAAPVLTESTSANTCTDTTATTTEMMDLGVSYTTQASTTGNIRVTLTFNVGTPATAAGLTSKWTMAYGTGTAPACNNGSPQGTTVGQQYTIQTEVASAGSMAQSEVVTLSGLSPSTAYWFDVQVSDSSAAAWVYSLASMSVHDEQLSGLRSANLAALQTPAKTCTVSSATTEMAGFGTSYTTGASGAYSGTVKVSLTFNIASPATAAALTGKWQLAYGTGTAPACDATTPLGTTVGNQYTVETVAAATLSESQTETVSVNLPLHSTTYWFDLQITDSSTASWVYSNPTLAVTELPTINNLPVNFNFSPNGGTCTDTTATTTLMEGDTYYTTPSTGTGTLLVHLAFNVGTPATAAGLTSKWQIAYGPVTTTAAAPACNGASAGTTVGNQYTIETIAAAAGSISQSEGAVITGLSHGVEYWFALQVTDSSGASWVYSNPELQVLEVMPATVPHDNTVSVSNPNSCSDTTTGAATMMGFATAYSTLSYGTGTIAATLTWKLTMPNTASDTATYLLTYGTGAPPGCVGGLTGTTVGQTYEFLNPAGVATQVEPSITITISGLTPGTTYWFDIRVNPSVTATVSSLPVLTVVEVV